MTFRLCAFRCAFVLGSLLSISISPANAEIVIGQSASLTGVTASQAKDLRDGALAYFTKVNSSGGIKGQTIRLVSLDDGGKADVTRQNTEKLIRDENALMLFAYTGRNAVLAGKEMAEKARVPFVAPFTGGAQVDERSYGVFTIRGSYEDEIRALVRQLIPIGTLKIGLVYLTDDTTLTNKKAFEEAMAAMGQKPAVVTSVDRDGKNVKDTIAAIAKTDAQSVIIIAPNKVLVDITKGLLAVGSKTKTASVSFVNGADLGKELGQNAAGIVLSQVVPLRGNVPLVSEFHKDLKAYQPTANPSFVSMEGYIAARAVVEGLRRMTKNPSDPRADFVRAMESLNEIDLSGYFLKFSPKNHNGSTYVELTMLKADGTFVK
jgi:branched-chain amino acid transport system substrate-binding protein